MCAANAIQNDHENALRIFKKKKKKVIMIIRINLMVIKFKQLKKKNVVWKAANCFSKFEVD